MHTFERMKLCGKTTHRYTAHSHHHGSQTYTYRHSPGHASHSERSRDTRQESVDSLPVTIFTAANHHTAAITLMSEDMRQIH